MFYFVTLCHLCSKKYQFESRKRVFPKDTSSPSMSITEAPGPSQATMDGPGSSQSVAAGSVGGASQTTTVDAPLKGFQIYIIGRLSMAKPLLTQQIESLGGKVVSKVTEGATVCLSNKGESEHGTASYIR